MVKKITRRYSEVNYDCLVEAISSSLELLEVDSAICNLVMEGEKERLKKCLSIIPIELMFLPKKALFSSKNVRTSKQIRNIEVFFDMVYNFADVMHQAGSNIQERRES